MSLTTLEFLQLVVPEQGNKLISTDPGRQGWRDRLAGDDHQSMVDLIEFYQSRPVNIYHANATFSGDKRKASEAQYLRALWLDLDVQKKTGRSYASQKEALNSVIGFIKDARLPKPNLFVSSGMGLHVYWCFDQDVPADRWLPMAQRLKDLTKHHDLLVDQSVIADKARVLRPIGTTWRDVKDFTDTTYPVKLLGANTRLTYPVEALETALSSGLTSDVPRPRVTMDTRINATLGAPEGTTYPPSDPMRIAAQCGQIDRFRRSGGNLTYEIWRLCIGVLVKAEGGEQLIHEWSAKNYPRYDRDETQQKIDTWNVPGATTCGQFQEKDEDDGPCSRCALKCNSPISLGYKPTKPQPFVNSEGEDDIFEPVCFPRTARINLDGELQMQVAVNKGTKANPELVQEWMDVSPIPFYPTSIAVRADGTLESDVAFFHRPGDLRSFICPHNLLQDARGLAKLVNAYGITGNPILMGKYLVSYIALLKQHIDDTKTYQQMGWTSPKANEFMIGETVITPTDIKTVRIGPNLQSKATLFDNSKPKQHWVDAVDRLYNLPHGQPYQFALCAAFGSALVPILNAEEYNGIPVALTSDESGYGKSTVCKIALSAFGRVERNNNVLTGDEVSTGAVEVQCSSFNNVPHLFDEMTNKGGPETSHILYMLSNGVARARLRQDGTPRPPSPPWRGISFITGNKNIFLKLTESRVNPEAAQMRVFEIPLENYPRLDSLRHASDFIELTNSVRSGYGAVGVEFLRYVMKNREKVEKLLWSAVNDLSKREGVRHGKERFYIYTIACATVAGGILRKLGLVDFNIQALYAWAYHHMATLRDTTNEHQRSAEEDFALMLATLVGEGKVISTCLESASGNELPLRAAPVMRIIRDPGLCVLTADGFNRYCLSVSKSPAKFKQELLEAGCFEEGYVVRADGKARVELVDFALGRGVLGLAVGTAKCYRLNFHKAIGPVANSMERLPDKVVSLIR